MLTQTQEELIQGICEDESPYYVLRAVIESYSNPANKRDLIDEMIQHLQYEGYITIKPSSILEEQKIEDFIVELKPHYNERQYLFI